MTKHFVFKNSRTVLSAIILLATLVSCEQSTQSSNSQDGDVDNKASQESELAGEFVVYPPVPIQRIINRFEGDTIDIENAGFEDANGGEVTGWKPDEGSEVAISQSADFRTDGDHSLLLEARTGERSIIRLVKTLDITPGTRRQSRSRRSPAHSPYALSYYSLGEDSGVTTYLQVQDAVNGPEVFSARTQRVDGTEGTWARHSTIFEVPAYTTRLTLKLVCEVAPNETNEAKNVYFDQVEFKKGPPPKGYVNLIANGGFESGATLRANWFVYDSVLERAKLLLETGEHRLHGKGTLRVDLPSDLSFLFRQTVSKVKPNDRYTFRGYVRTQDLAGSLMLMITRDDNPGVVLAQSELSSTGTEEWKWLTLEFTVPEDAKAVRASLFRAVPKDADGSTGSFWTDFIELYKVP